MEQKNILEQELKGSVNFFLDFTNLDPNSIGFGLTVDSTKKPKVASIASSGFALSAWVIAAERGFLSRSEALRIIRGTLRTLRDHASHYRGFFAHFLQMEDGERFKQCEFSTIDTALCLNGVITAAAYFQDGEITDMAENLLERVDWDYFVFEREGKTLLRMAYNPDRRGDYVRDEPGFISQWDMAAEQRMMYLQAARQVEPAVARALYHGFRRNTGLFDGQEIIIIPGGSLFAYHFTEAWLDTRCYLDPDGVDWFQNSRLAALANRSYCIDQGKVFKTFHANSWGLSAGDSPTGYHVYGAPPSLEKPNPDGTVSIYAALSCLPFIPEQTLEMVDYLFHNQPEAWGKYGFFDSYNLDVTPPWYSRGLYGIGKGPSMIMIENYLSQLIWNTYTFSPRIQQALDILGFIRRKGASHE